jgi:hypothetical protein
MKDSTATQKMAAIWIRVLIQPLCYNGSVQMLAIASVLTLVAVVADGQTETSARSGKVPQIHSFWPAPFERESLKKDQNQHFIAPWTKGSFRIALMNPPTADLSITLVPVGVSLPTLRSKIGDVRKFVGGCEETTVSWDAVVQVDQPNYLDAATLPNHLAESPFNAVVIYPAVPFAKSVPRVSLKDEMLPKGVARSTVAAAIDLTGDGSPDLLVVEYCFSDATKTPEQCDYSIQDSYEKRNGKWVRLRHVTPC